MHMSGNDSSLTALLPHEAKWREATEKITHPHTDFPTNVLRIEEYQKYIFYMITLKMERSHA